MNNDSKSTNIDRADLAWFPELEFKRVSSHYLSLMPFPQGCSSTFKSIQECTRKFLDVSSSVDARFEALDEATNSIKLMDSEQSKIYYVELMSKAKDLKMSLTYIYRKSQVRLNSIGLNISRFKANSFNSYNGIPAIVDKQGAPANEAIDHLTWNYWSRGLSILECMNAEDAQKMSTGERLSGIDLLFLCILNFHKSPVKGLNRSGLEYAKGAGRSIWRMLMDGLNPADMDNGMVFSECYGDAAYAAVLLHASASVETSQSHRIQPLSDAELEKCEEESCEGVPVAHASHVHQIITGDIPPTRDADDKLTIKRFETLKTPLPLSSLPTYDELISMRDKLSQEFPWALDAVHEVTRQLILRSQVGSAFTHFSPLLLLGQTGLGKSRFVRRVAELLQVSSLKLDFAGMTDARMITGTSRGWSSGQPSPLLEEALSRQCASVIVQADEIDKCSLQTYSNGGSPLAALLCLLEPSTARYFTDTFLQTSCDLTPYMYMLTSNSIDKVPPAILSRVRPVLFRNPTREQLLACVRCVAQDILLEMGADLDVFAEACDIYPSQISDGPTNLRELKVEVSRIIAEWIHARRGPGRLH